VTVSASVADLSADVTYHFRIAVGYAGGSGEGGDLTFATKRAEPPTPPTVTTEEASAVTQTSAGLNAIVNPNGNEVSECEFEYGPTTSYGSSAPCTPSPGAGRAPVAVSATLTDLAAGTVYHFRVAATNHGGTSYGSDQTFTILAAAQPPSTETPSAVTQPAVVAPQAAITPLLSPIEAPRAPAPLAELASTSLAVSSTDTLTVTMRCPAGATSCKDTLTLRTLGAVSAGAHGHQAAKRILTLASDPITIASGRVVTIRLRLSVAARSLLAHSHVLRARAIIAALDTDGSEHATQTDVTLRALHVRRAR